MAIESTINYLIPLPTDKETPGGSRFQGFSNSLLWHSSWVRTILSRCPPTVQELYSQTLRSLEMRLLGLSNYRIVPILDSDLFRIEAHPSNPFWVLLADSTTSSIAKEWSEKQIVPIHFVIASNETSIPELPTRQSIRRHCDEVLDLLKKSFPEIDARWAVEARTKAKEQVPLPIDFGFTGHNVTIPNELLLLSVGGVFDGEQERLVGKDAKYISRILQVADEAAIVRHAIPASPFSSTLLPLPTVILAAPGILWHVKKERPRKGQGQIPFFRLMRKLQQQTTYCLQFEDDDAAEMKELLEDPDSQRLLQIRTLEQNAFTNALSVRSASHLCPVLRLSPAINHTSSSLIRLADCLRSERPSQRKVSQLTAELTAALEAAVPQEFIERIDLPHSGIKLVSDAPLELLPIRGLPLLLRHVTSRIPVTPGNQTFMELLPQDPLEISVKHFSETLVIRSFQDDDPIRLELETAVRHYPLSDGSPIPARFVDVRTRADLESALAEFNGAFVVFDLHGRHRRDENYGKLQLADELVNPWDLRKTSRMPPLAFLCSCDTHAYDRSHATPGSGLLACGARAVIATVLPVHSHVAAIFAARLLFRIYEYLPLITNELRQLVRWDNVFSLLQRMMYVLELVSKIPVGEKDDSWRSEVMNRATPLIHTSYDWYELVLEDIAKSTGLSLDDIDEIRRKKLSFPETFKYLHLGNPESVVIRPTEYRAGDYFHQLGSK